MVSTTENSITNLQDSWTVTIRNCIYDNAINDLIVSSQFGYSTFKVLIEKCHYYRMPKAMKVSVNCGIRCEDCVSHDSPMFLFTGCRWVKVINCNGNSQSGTIITVTPITSNTNNNNFNEITGCNIEVNNGKAIEFDNNQRFDTRIIGNTFTGNSAYYNLVLTGPITLNSNIFVHRSGGQKLIKFTSGGEYDLTLGTGEESNCFPLKFIDAFDTETPERIKAGGSVVDRWDSANNRCWEPTNQFSLSHSFTISHAFSNSNMMSRSNNFPATNKFTSSNLMSNSMYFTESNEFISSEKFSQSIHFKVSDHFSQSMAFKKTDHFSQSIHFKVSDHFSQSIVFKETNHFTRSGAFRETDRFSFSTEFDSSMEFSQSLMFEETNLFIKSYQFSESFHLSRIEKEESSEIQTKMGFSSLEEDKDSSLKQEETASSEINVLPTITQTEKHQSSEKDEIIESSQLMHEEATSSHNNIFTEIEDKIDSSLLDREEDKSSEKEDIVPRTSSLDEEDAQPSSEVNNEKPSQTNEEDITNEIKETQTKILETFTKIKDQTSNPVEKESFTNDERTLYDSSTMTKQETMSSYNEEVYLPSVTMIIKRTNSNSENLDMTIINSQVEERTKIKSVNVIYTSEAVEKTETNKELTTIEDIKTDTKMFDRSTTQATEPTTIKYDGKTEQTSYITKSSTNQLKMTTEAAKQTSNVMKTNASEKVGIDESTFGYLDSISDDLNYSSTQVINYHISVNIDDTEERKVSGGQIAGITIGVVIAVILVVLIIIFFLYKRSNVSSISSNSDSISIEEAMRHEMDSVETNDNLTLTSILSSDGLNTGDEKAPNHINDRKKDISDSYDYDYFDEMVFPKK